MNIEEIRFYCLQKAATTESFPFDETTLVFKVADKMFALLSLEVPYSINLKCEPEKALALREKYYFILPGYHMNKKHWNTLQLDDKPPVELIKSLIDHSYDLVVDGLPKKTRLAWNLA
ncbi:MAG: MmcQ/YjbR family DNA-binding protein [Chitinophagales bacterium]|nr:MmcQ/YjbR family DNA-binding protein [Bacteroidota bacterium]MCB9043573.1 MmcQ/YjbR family DNA-binding protein [Chitinophagales bacterium]